MVNVNRTIKAVLQKKYWDGRDAGRIFLYNMARTRFQLNKNKVPTPVYPQSELNYRVDALSERERLQYRMYEGIGDMVTRFMYSQSTTRMDIYYDFLLYQSKIEALRAKDEAKRDMAAEPIIMTKKQFDREYTQALREYKAQTVSYYDLIILEVISALQRKQGALFDTVLDELEPLRNEKATDAVMMKYYNRQANRGYYAIPSTGLRSDQTDLKTWDDAVETLISKLAARIIKFEMRLRSVPEGKGNTLAAVGRYRQYRAMEYLYNGWEAILAALHENGLGQAYTGPDGITFTPAEIEYTAAKVIDTLPMQAIFIASPDPVKEAEDQRAKDWHMKEDLANLFIYGGAAPVWHYYEDPPADLNKYDLLTKCISIYGSDAGNVCYGSEKKKANAFKKEFPKLFEEALREVVRKVGEPAEGTAITDPVLRMGTLQRNKQFDEDNIKALFEEWKPAQLREMEQRGVAVIDDKLLKPEDVDKRGNYKPRIVVYRELRELLRKLEGREGTAPRDILNEDIIPDVIKYYVFNQMIDIFTDVADVPLLTVFKSDTDELESAAKELNKKIFYLVYKTYAGTQRDAATREEFRAQVKKIFKPIDMNQYRATAAELEPIRQEVRAFIMPPHIFKAEKLLTAATVNHIEFALLTMSSNLRSIVERRCKGE